MTSGSATDNPLRDGQQELPADLYEVTQVDDAGRLFISPVIHDWDAVSSRDIDTIIDLEGGLDIGVPTVPNQILYVYFPILDEDLPDLEKLDAVADLGAALVGRGHRVLSHCGMGFNRSALVAGLIFNRLGMPGPQVVERSGAPERSSMNTSRDISKPWPVPRPSLTEPGLQRAPRMEDSRLAAG